MPAADAALPSSRGDAATVAGESFEVFYLAHLDRIYRALAVTLKDVDLAREAADEAMVRAYSHWPRIRRHDNPAGWVYRVGLNWATSWWRKVHRERHPIPESAGAPHHDAQEDTAALLLLTGLPMAQRSVVVCRVLLELSTAETAAALGIAEGTVKSRLARALASLRAAMTAVDPAEEKHP